MAALTKTQAIVYRLEWSRITSVGYKKIGLTSKVWNLCPWCGVKEGETHALACDFRIFQAHPTDAKAVEMLRSHQWQREPEHLTTRGYIAYRKACIDCNGENWHSKTCELDRVIKRADRMAEKDEK